MKTAANNKKIREIITLVQENKLIPRPEFQRRLVWTREDKNNFIDTILNGYPFPEIYIADGDVNLETGKGTQLLVDGLQRVSTIVEYFTGDPSLRLTTVPFYNDLKIEEKKAFLLYDVAVRDLGGISNKDIIEVFKRLNSTNYSLRDIEVSNAVYSGALKKFADRIASHAFFQVHSVFNAMDYKRMGDLRYSLSIVATLLTSYFNRDEMFEDLLDRYNDDFPMEREIEARIENVFNFIDECGFDPSSRIWKKADLFSFIIEVDQVLNVVKIDLSPNDTVEKIQSFLDGIDKSMKDPTIIHYTYYKAALQATNDKLNRFRRGIILGSLLLNRTIEEIETELRANNLL